MLNCFSAADFCAGDMLCLHVTSTACWVGCRTILHQSCPAAVAECVCCATVSTVSCQMSMPMHVMQGLPV